MFAGLQVRKGLFNPLFFARKKRFFLKDTAACHAKNHFSAVSPGDRFDFKGGGGDGVLKRSGSSSWHTSKMRVKWIFISFFFARQSKYRTRISDLFCTPFFFPLYFHPFCCFGNATHARTFVKVSRISKVPFFFAALYDRAREQSVNCFYPNLEIFRR